MRNLIFMSGVMLYLNLVYCSVFAQAPEVEPVQPVPPIIIEQVSSSPNPISQAQGKLVSSSEYQNLKNLWNELANFVPHSEETFDARRKDTLAGLDQILKALEKKALTGRWGRSFFKSEFRNRFDQIGLDRNLIEQKSISEEDRITLFWKETDFCHEGFFTLDRFREYDAWLSDLVKERTKRAFHLIRGVKFQKRLDHLKISREAYREKLTQLMDAFDLYEGKVCGKTQPILIGKSKDKVTDVLVRPLSPRGNWIQITKRKENEFYDTDLLEVQAKEDKKVILQDRRYLILEGGAILAGWELKPKIPETLYKEITRLIEQLGNDDWHLREAATEELIKIGEPAIPAVKEALKHKDPEIRMRANLILKKITTTPEEELEKKVREIVEQVMDQGYRQEFVTQLLGPGKPYNIDTHNQIISILQKLQNERPSDHRWRSTIRWLITMVQRQRK